MPAKIPMNMSNFLRLPRNLSSLETWGFGLTGLLLWISSAPGIRLELGPQSIWVWLPGIIIGVMVNFQVKRLGEFWQDLSGGTPNYITRLLFHYPRLGSYAAIGYYISWVAVLPANAIIIADFLEANLHPLGIEISPVIFRVGFTLLAFLVAFSGTRSLGILHLFFVVPAVGFLLLFCVQGIAWLALAPESPGLMPADWSNFDLGGWAQLYIIAAYAVYACETASSFVADSEHPKETLRVLTLAGWLIPVVYLGGSWLLMRLATSPNLGDNAYLNLLTASQPFWGKYASLLVTFLVLSGSLLSCATAASNSPRMLYQLALDGYISPVFAVTSRQGVLGPALILTLILSLLWLSWGDLARIVFITGIGWLFSFCALHWGLWLNRQKPQVLWPYWSLVFAIFELIVLIIGGISWNWQDSLIGLFLPIGILIIDRLIRINPITILHPSWWQRLYQRHNPKLAPDFMMIQVIILIVLVTVAVVFGWLVRGHLDLFNTNATTMTNIFILLLLTVAFVEVAIAGWTSLPQITAIASARQQAEHLFMIAIDAIISVNEQGIIVKVNPATEELLNLPADRILQKKLQQFLPDISRFPDDWESRSEQIIPGKQGAESQIIEVAVSTRLDQDFREYVVILRDITEKKKAEVALQNYSITLEEKVAERTYQLAQASREIQKLNSQLTAENLRMGAEIDILWQMQKLILPKFEELQEITELDIAGFMEPAEEVGGDYYDVLYTDGVVTIGIGDVTGHGLESGILMVMTQTAVRTLKEIQEVDPVRFLDTLNKTIYKNVQRMNSDKNLTLAILNYTDGILSISGQHEETLIIRKNGSVERINMMNLGFPIGLDSEIADFIDHLSIELNAGDGLVVYTDGITEARNTENKFYGLERLCDVISENWQKDSEQVKEAVIDDLKSYIGKQKVYDDITLLVVKKK